MRAVFARAGGAIAHEEKDGAPKEDAAKETEKAVSTWKSKSIKASLEKEDAREKEKENAASKALEKEPEKKAAWELEKAKDPDHDQFVTSVEIPDTGWTSAR